MTTLYINAGYFKEVAASEENALRAQNIPVGPFSSERLLLPPDSDRWFGDTEMQLGEEPSPHWWGVNKQREGENRIAHLPGGVQRY